jgi:hypothetical protein
MNNTTTQEKKQKIVIGINSLVATRHQAYSNHIQYFFRLGRNYPNIDFILFNPDRMSIDRMRNTAADLALECEADWLLFIDDDVLVPFDSLKRLLAVDADICAADVCIRGYPFDHMLFQYNSDRGLVPMPSLPAEKGVIDCGAVGFSYCLIKVSLLKRMHKPYFITGATNTEDIYFCLKAVKEVPEVTIKADTDIECHHLLWDECISSHNKQAYKEYYEKMNPSLLKKAESSGDRGTEYAEMVKNVTASD